jgi:hypothetical protein
LGKKKRLALHGNLYLCRSEEHDHCTQQVAITPRYHAVIPDCSPSTSPKLSRATEYGTGTRIDIHSPSIGAFLATPAFLLELLDTLTTGKKKRLIMIADVLAECAPLGNF